MIRYPASLADLEAAVDTLSSDWRTRAQARTDRFRSSGTYDEKKGEPFWSEIKRAYMALQHSKCAYCERKLEGAPIGYIEHDVEHYRPKNAVKKWPPRRWPPESVGGTRAPTYEFPVGEAWAEGYYLLAYHLQNYATACKVCNSTLKSNYFPISGTRGPQQAQPADLAGESPLLIFPLGDVDQDDPEDLIDFDGIIPIPRYRDGPKHRRALVTIDFFMLEKREHLSAERAKLICDLWIALFALESTQDADMQALCQQQIDRLLSPRSPHTSCIRAFHQRYLQDKEEASKLSAKAAAYLASLGQ